MRNTLDLNPKFFSCMHNFWEEHILCKLPPASCTGWWSKSLVTGPISADHVAAFSWQFSLCRKNKRTTVVVEETVPIWVSRPYAAVNDTSWCQLPPWSSPPGCPRRPQCCRPLTNNCRWGEDSSNLSISAQCCGEWAADCRKQYTDRLLTKTLEKEEHFFLRLLLFWCDSTFSVLGATMSSWSMKSTNVMVMMLTMMMMMI